MIEKTNKQMKVNTKLPDYLIPRTPKRGRKRVEWRRQVHEKREDFKEHALARAERQEVKQFESEKIKERRVRRGEAWREENERMLGDRIEDKNIRNRISRVFEGKVKSAVKSAQDDKERKEKRKNLFKGKVVPVRKW